MKTPHAVLIGLALIAAAIFFQAPTVKPAKAASDIKLLFSCWSGDRCAVLAEGTIFYLSQLDRRSGPELRKFNWTNGDAVR